MSSEKLEDDRREPTPTELEYTRRVIADIEAGEQDAAAGRMMTADELRQRLAERRRKREQRAGGSRSPG